MDAPTYNGDDDREFSAPVCPACDGEGFCNNCNGIPPLDVEPACAWCEGTGRCPDCHGTGCGEAGQS